jgi:hypothetical protein
LQLQAHVSAHRGDPQGVLDSLDTMLKLGQSLDGEPALTPLLLRIAIDGMAQHTLEQLLPYLALDDNQLLKLQGVWADIDYQTQLVAALRGERVSTLHYFDQPETFDPEMADGLNILHGVTGPYDKAYYLETMGRFEQAAAGPLCDARLATQILDEQLAMEQQSNRKLGRALSLMAFPTTIALVDTVCRATAGREGVVASAAAERYRLNHGEWPAVLADLTPDFLPSIPIDPFDGRPLRYRVDEDGLCVYGIGRNGRDDGGLDDPVDGDVVFRVPRRSAAP